MADGIVRGFTEVGALGDLAELGRWGKFLGGAGPVFDALGIVVGGFEAVDNGLDWMSSGDSQDLYNAGDGYVTAALSTTALATAWIPGVNLVTGGIAAAWGIADGLNDLISDGR